MGACHTGPILSCVTTSSVPPAALPASRLRQALAGAARREHVVAAVLTSHRCPWCIALMREQLEPRMRSRESPALVVVEMDIDDATAIALPDGSAMTASQWGVRLGMNLTPTLAMLDRQARPIRPPLVGYASRDFYAAYLEEQIKAAQLYWQNS
jgi:hypothetical protein